MKNDSIISVNGLKKSFGDVIAVNDLSMNVLRGDIYGLLGINGSGKSTTIKMLMSLVSPDIGDIKIFNKNIQLHTKEINADIGALIERADFYEYLSAYKNLELLLRYSGINPTRELIMDTLELVGLTKFCSKKVGIFSQGMKQRLGIAQAIIHKPDILILDEPMNGLDPHGIVDVRNLIQKLNGEGITILLSSHLLKEVEALSNRMIIIHEGKSLAEGEVKELLTTDKETFRLKTTDLKKSYDLLEKSKLVNEVEMMNDFLLLKTYETKIPKVNNLLVKEGHDVLAIEPVRSLEDFFLSLT